ncbi:MAG: hypothetical protein Q8K86_09010 [Candidatus Nanopelagicaceae bacterium]|nr:hypothetical protein [Candidatus Nanopelagicaceae bacterium]
MNSPNVKFDNERQFILVEKEGTSTYHVDLRNVVTEQDVLNVILHLHEKSWCDPKTFNQFIVALKDAVLCNFGIDIRSIRGRKLNWKEGKIS